MFSRRNRTPSMVRSHGTTSPGPAPSSAASLAAAQAFLANRASNANLSSAAAAAALRSQTKSPRPVSEVQTKRMIQRQNSQSSHGSAPSDSIVLGRRSSLGSMTERSFRDASPNRPPSRSSESPMLLDYPPVPPVPVRYGVPPPPPKSHKRPSSMDPVGRLSSSVLGHLGRGASLDRGPNSTSTSPRMGKKQRHTSLTTFPEEQSRRNSTNFSRPISPQNPSPTKIAQATQAPSSPQPKATAPRISPREQQNIDYNTNATSTAEVKTKKRGTALNGSYRATGTLSVRQIGNTVHELDAGRAPVPIDLSGSLGTLDDRATLKQKKAIAASVRPSSMVYASDSDGASERSTTDIPRNTTKRPTGFLIKQPSMVREDPEAEEIEEQSILSKARGKAQKGTPHRSLTSNEKSGTLMADAELLPSARYEPELLSTTRYEPESRTMATTVSPTRAAHFTSQPSLGTTQITKHVPPERSLSPAKSALKRSSSPGGSGQAYKSGIALSEASDVSSTFSEDGPRIQPKRKPKVSFDEGLAIIGQTITPPSSHNSSASTPQETKKAWFGIGSKKYLPASKMEDDVIKPVPILPSFGSIRGRRDKQDDSGVVGLASKAKGQGVPVDALGISHDHALGDILQRDTSNSSPILPGPPSASHGPLPPQVTSVEGSGYQSDSDQSIIGSQIQVGFGSRGNGPQRGESSNALGATFVPVIAVLPATPGGERSTEPIDKEHAISNPSPFGEQDDQGSMTNHQFAEATPSSVGIAEPPPEASHLPDESSPIVAISEAIRQHDFHDDSDSESGNSVYSDAAEEVSDGDGFGSINAIVESPVIPQTMAQKVSTIALPRTHDYIHSSGLSSTPSKGPVAKPKNTSVKQDTGQPAVQDWNEAKAQWSGLSQSRKAEIEDEARRLEQEKSIATTAKSKGKQKTANTVATFSTGVPKSPLAMPLTPTKPRPADDSPHLRITMRGPSPTTELQPVKSARRTSAPVGQSPGMRSSMRNSIPEASSLVGRSPTANTSLPPSDTKGATGAQRNRPRPISHTPVAAVSVVDYLSSPTRGPGHTRAASANATLTPIPAKRTASSTKVTPIPPMPTSSTKPISSKKPAALTTPTSPIKSPKKPLTISLRRTASNGSDSSSSFKKARVAGGRQGHSMRRSMRSLSERPRSDIVSSKFSVRSVSPRMESRRPLSPGMGGMGMRSTMRDSPRSTNPKSPTHSLGFGRSKSPSGSLGFGRDSARTPTKAPSKPISRFRSRFNDSSDEEDGPKTYQSRYADSSDEDAPRAPIDLTPVRGIPRRIDEGESTDLEESVEEAPAIRPLPATQKKPPPIVTKVAGPNAQGQTILGHNSRRFSTVPGKGPVAIESKKRRGLLQVLGRRKEKAKIQKSDVESAARRDTPLERTRFERNSLIPLHDKSPVSPPSSILKNSSNDSPQSSPRSPKLQRRNTPKRYTSDMWPTPPPIPAPSGSRTSTRPHTSDGIPRPVMGTRTLTGQTAHTEDAAQVLGRLGKKKRFPMLRKAFGLTD